MTYGNVNIILDTKSRIGLLPLRKKIPSVMRDCPPSVSVSQHQNVPVSSGKAGRPSSWKWLTKFHKPDKGRKLATQLIGASAVKVRQPAAAYELQSR